MEELLSAYYKVGLVLVVVTALLRRASRFALLVTAPLLLTTGSWTLVLGIPAQHPPGAGPDQACRRLGCAPR